MFDYNEVDILPAKCFDYADAILVFLGGNKGRLYYNNHKYEDIDFSKTFEQNNKENIDTTVFIPRILSLNIGQLDINTQKELKLAIYDERTNSYKEPKFNIQDYFLGNINIAEQTDEIGEFQENITKKLKLTPKKKQKVNLKLKAAVA